MRSLLNVKCLLLKQWYLLIRDCLNNFISVSVEQEGCFPDAATYELRLTTRAAAVVVDNTNGNPSLRHRTTGAYHLRVQT